ncbi:hypothetical protein HYS00_02415 [Candidatus Microgenomates bacterium]|nr:hypothetical protein [Candidatus Microgenomates bacterium]
MLLILFVLQFLTTVWWIVLQTFPSHSTIWNFVYNGVYGLVFLYGGIVGSAFGTKLGGWKSSIGRATILISSGLLFYGIGQFVWMYYNMYLHNNVPYPSLADLFFILLSPLVGLGFWYILSMYRTFISRRLIIELFITLIVIGSINIIFVTRPDLSNEVGLWGKVLNIYYPLSDSLLASLAFITFRTGGGKFEKSILLFSAGMLLMSTADTLFTFRNNTGAYWNGDITDLLFALGGFTLSWGIIRTLESFVKVDPVKT